MVYIKFIILAEIRVFVVFDVGEVDVRDLCCGCYE